MIVWEATSGRRAVRAVSAILKPCRSMMATIESERETEIFLERREGGGGGGKRNDDGFHRRCFPRGGSPFERRSVVDQRRPETTLRGGSRMTVRPPESIFGEQKDSRGRMGG